MRGLRAYAFTYVDMKKFPLVKLNFPLLPGAPGTFSAPMQNSHVKLSIRLSFSIAEYFVFYRNGCATSEDLFWKLDALQSFIRDLHWPDAEFAGHLEQRLKLMAADMMESSIQR